MPTTRRPPTRKEPHRDTPNFTVSLGGHRRTTIRLFQRNGLQHAAGQERTDHFYPDARLRATYKANLTDYQDSGYDRGHMAAAAKSAENRHVDA